jgi:hypothetical protein
MPPARRRPTQSFDPAIITRIEALSRELRDAVPNTSFVGRNGTQSVDCTADHHQSHVERRHDKREKKLDKLHEEVLRQQSETETLRENLDQSFRETSAHHTQFLQWYREKNRQIDAKYAKLGVRCPFVTGRGADAFTYPFRELDVTSPVTGKKTVHRSPVTPVRARRPWGSRPHRCIARPPLPSLRQRSRRRSTSRPITGHRCVQSTSIFQHRLTIDKGHQRDGIANKMPPTIVFPSLSTHRTDASSLLLVLHLVQHHARF